MTDAGRLNLDEHFTGTWAFEVHGFQTERFACLAGDDGANLHCHTRWRTASENGTMRKPLSAGVNCGKSGTFDQATTTVSFARPARIALETQ